MPKYDVYIYANRTLCLPWIIAEIAEVIYATKFAIQEYGLYLVSPYKTIFSCKAQFITFYMKRLVAQCLLKRLTSTCFTNMQLSS